MKLLFTLALVFFALPTLAEEPAKIDEAKEGGATALIIDALRGLSALLPKPEEAPEEKAAVSTIGIRGSESTATLITPYWKDDRSSDPTFAAELSAYTAAHDLLAERRWDDAQQAMSNFLTSHPKSDLTPNARFGRALAAAGANHGDEAASQFRLFARDYPGHPLRADAEKLAAALVKAL